MPLKYCPTLVDQSHINPHIRLFGLSSSRKFAHVGNPGKLARIYDSV